MPTNIADKIYLGDILLCAGAGGGECGACVGSEATFLTFDNSNIDFDALSNGISLAFGPSSIDYNLIFTNDIASLSPSNINFAFSVSLYSGVVV